VENSTIFSTTPIIGAKSSRSSRAQLKERLGTQRERSYAGGEDYDNSGGAILKWLMARALVARTRFGSSRKDGSHRMHRVTVEWAH